MEMQKRFVGLGLVALWISVPAQALLERALSFDVGFGVPQFLALQGNVLVSKHWQVGVGYGYAPQFNLNSGVVPNQSITISGIPVVATFTPSINIDMISPFVRFFPGESNFYFQFMYGILRTKAVLSGKLTALGGAIPFDAVLGVDGTVIQTLPTLSIGSVFAGKLYFLNLSLGVTVLGSTSVSFASQTTIPGGTSDDKNVLDQASANASNAANNAVNKVRTEAPLIPSVFFSMGIFI